ncbi:MAG TPA: putative lipid II flippase FtsW [Smithellaceae bacterium]|nr:putative lipid II flippase FtsW [Smithellaceae bacterium]HQF83676.1 putative lipid II flippase FtsW [Smithellaceae bacterium]HQG79775.1 putative lipid II flippase FtsW [Smithellaceae bacterium]
MEEVYRKETNTPDMVLLIVTLILVTVGTAMIYSSSSIVALEKFKDAQYFLKKHLFFVFAGLVLMIVMTRVPYEYLRKVAYPGVILSIVLLLMLFVPSLGIKRGGATRWLNAGVFTFQVAEVVKVAVVIFLAHLLTRKVHQLKRFSRGVLVPLSVTAVLMGLVLLQPDFGTVVILSLILLLMLTLAGSRFTHLMALGAVFIPLGIFLVTRKGYRMARLTAFLDPWKDPDRTGFQLIQSMISFGSGGLFGQGIGDGMQKLFYLPEPHTDFILAVIAEESGFIGVSAIVCLFMILLWRGFMIAYHAPDLFGTLLAAGLTMLVGIQVFINIAGVMGLIPLKGLALPFLSYGGTAFMMSMMLVGVLLNISANRT